MGGRLRSRSHGHRSTLRPRPLLRELCDGLAAAPRAEPRPHDVDRRRHRAGRVAPPSHALDHPAAQPRRPAAALEHDRHLQRRSQNAPQHVQLQVPVLHDPGPEQLPLACDRAVDRRLGRILRQHAVACPDQRAWQERTPGRAGLWLRCFRSRARLLLRHGPLPPRRHGLRRLRPAPSGDGDRVLGGRLPARRPRWRLPSGVVRGIVGGQHSAEGRRVLLLPAPASRLWGRGVCQRPAAARGAAALLCRPARRSDWRHHEQVGPRSRLAGRQRDEVECEPPLGAHGLEQQGGPHGRLGDGGQQHAEAAGRHRVLRLDGRLLLRRRRVPAA
mmetsp:Transcript_2613/g.8769  ORF Transcript_2613/g.8769 Transcript_2613/m.8769 type:complete len:330 (+) Transcript_2613:293-1282(+)